MKKLITCIILSCLIVGIFAQAPQKFNYQAVIRNASGNPLANTLVSFRISIIKKYLVNTTNVYTETQTATTNAQGVVTLLVGSGDSDDEFSDINWSGSNLPITYKLKIEMDPAGGTGYEEYSESQLVSVPYALYAEKAGNGIDSSFFIADSEEPFNTGTGYQVLMANTTGKYNTANGYQALYSNTTSDCNTANGYQVLYSNTTGEKNTANGFYVLYSNTTGSSNTAYGFKALYSNTTGANNTADGYGAGYNSTGNNNTFLGSGADVSNSSLSNATAIGYNAKVTAGNTIMLGNSSVTNVYSYGTFGNPSDRRLKENIVYSDKLGLDFILKLKTASYNYIADSAKHRRDGLIAQDIQQALSELSIEFSGLSVNDNPEKTMNLSYSEFVIPLINAVQEQQESIELQQQQITALKQQNELLLQMINELKK